MTKGSRNSPLRICYVYIVSITRKNKYVAGLVPILMAKTLKGCAVIYVLYSGNIDEDKLKTYGIKPYEYGVKRFNLGLDFLFKHISLIHNVYKLACKEKIDLFMNVWCHYLLFPVVFGAKLAGKKVVARVVGVPISPGYREKSTILAIARKKFGLTLEKASLLLVDHVHLISNFLRDCYIKRGCPSFKMSVISTGVDINQLRPMSLDQTGAGKKILFVGRLERNKGAEYVIRAFKILSSKLKDTKCIMVGKGEELEKLQRLCEEFDLGSKVNFMGSVSYDELPAIYNSVELLVVPSLSEGLSKVTLEALACGTPVIGTNVGELPTLLSDGRGIIVPPKNTRCLAKEIMKLLSNDKLRREMGEKGREYVIKEHSFSFVREKYLDLFNKVVKS